MLPAGPGASTGPVAPTNGGGSGGGGLEAVLNNPQMMQALVQLLARLNQGGGQGQAPGMLR